MTLDQIPFTAAGNLTRDPELRSVGRLQARARTIRHGRRRGGGAANTVGWVELLRRGRAELAALPPGDPAAGARRARSTGPAGPHFADPARTALPVLGRLDHRGVGRGGAAGRRAWLPVTSVLASAVLRRSVSSI